MGNEKSLEETMLEYQNRARDLSGDSYLSLAINTFAATYYPYRLGAKDVEEIIDKLAESSSSPEARAIYRLAVQHELERRNFRGSE